MRRPAPLLALVLAAGLVTACSGGRDEAVAPAPSTSVPPASTPVPTPDDPDGSAGPTPAASLSSTEQVQALRRIYDRLDPAAQAQFCAQSDRVGPAALAEQLTQQGASRLDPDLLEEFLVDTCGAG